MSDLKKEMVGGIRIDMEPLASIINALKDMGYKINKHPLSDLKNFSYKLFVESDSNKEIKNLVIEIEKHESKKSSGGCYNYDHSSGMGLGGYED